MEKPDYQQKTDTLQNIKINGTIYTYKKDKCLWLKTICIE